MIAKRFPASPRHHSPLRRRLASFALSLFAACPAFASDDDCWFGGFAFPPDGLGLNENVADFAVYGGELVAAGEFTREGGAGGNHVARWDGTAWRRLQSGMDSRVMALLVHDGDLYAGGDFLTAAGLPAKHVARWNGSAWSAVGNGLEDGVGALTVFQAELVAGGRFTVAGGSPGNLVARWDGSSWQGVGLGLGGDGPPPAVVWALAEYGGHLYAGGEFTEADGTPVTHLARWDGASWSGFGATLTREGAVTGQYDHVHVLSTDADGGLLVGGEFSHVNGIYCNGLARWDGTDWTPLGAGLAAPAAILDVAFYHGDLVVFGDFGDGSGPNMVARWDGGSWTSLGSGAVAYDGWGGPGAAIVFAGDLYIGGNIDSAGGKPSRHIARWTDAATGVVGGSAAVTAVTLRAPAPNPFRHATELTYSLPVSGAVDLRVHDAAGRLVAVLDHGVRAAGVHAVGWRGTDGKGGPVAPGVYFIRLLAEDRSETRKVVVAR